ncbi:MAG: hypothetical protein KU38_10395, partial [Sulfurovum sp. FS08-3]
MPSGDKQEAKTYGDNSPITQIITQTLGEKATKEIVESLTLQIEQYYSKTDEKLDKLLDNNKGFVDNLMIQINHHMQTNTSLIELLTKAQKEREEAIVEIEKLKEQNKDGDFDRVLDEAQKALEEYDSQKYRQILASYRENEKNKQLIKNIAQTHYLSAKSYASDYLHEKAEKEILKAITLDDTNGAYLHSYGYMLYNTARYDEALKYYKQSLAIRQAIGDRSGEGTTLNNISGIYHARGDLTTALEYLQKSLAIHQAIGDRSGEGATLNNISQIYQVRGDLTTALEYLQKSLALTQAIGDKSGEGATLNNIATIHNARGDLTTALEYLQKSLALTQAIGDKSGEGATLNNISQIYDARGDLTTA